MITLQQLTGFTGVQNITKLTDTVNSLNDIMTKYEINTPLRVCHFMSQVLHESGNLAFVKENLNYSSTGLTITFHKYFSTIEVAKPFARQPEKIANHIYSGRMGNGNEASGDGFKFIGRGYIQLTGRENYAAISKDTGIDFINHPELLEIPRYAVLSAAWFWKKHGLNAIADKDDILAVTKTINGGTKGLDDRQAKLTKLKTLIK